MKIYVKRKIAAAHWLPYYVGPCQNLHGHTWLAEVWLEGEVNPKTGMVVDFKKVKDIIDVYDHKCLNDFLNNPTVEHLVQLILERLQSQLGLQNVRVRVWESDDAYAEAQIYESAKVTGVVSWPFHSQAHFAFPPTSPLGGSNDVPGEWNL